MYKTIALNVLYLSIIHSSLGQGPVIRNISWGMNIDEVEQIEGKTKVLYADENVLAYEGKLFFDRHVNLKFGFCSKEHLKQIWYHYPATSVFDPKSVNKTQKSWKDESMYIKLILEKYLEKYGSAYRAFLYYYKTEASNLGDPESDPVDVEEISDFELGDLESKVLFNEAYPKIKLRVEWVNKNSSTSIFYDFVCYKYSKAPYDGNFYFGLDLVYNEITVNERGFDYFSCDKHLNTY